MQRSEVKCDATVGRYLQSVLNGKYLLHGAVSTGRQVYSKKYSRCDVVLELGRVRGRNGTGIEMGYGIRLRGAQMSCRGICS